MSPGEENCKSHAGATFKSSAKLKQNQRKHILESIAVKKQWYNFSLENFIFLLKDWNLSIKSHEDLLCYTQVELTFSTHTGISSLLCPSSPTTPNFTGCVKTICCVRVFWGFFKHSFLYCIDSIFSFPCAHKSLLRAPGSNAVLQCLSLSSSRNSSEEDAFW